MKHRDIKIGMTVYHSFFVHWGKGVVKAIATSLCSSGKRYAIDWENQGKKICRIRDLRKTPNKKKIQELSDVKMYREFHKKMRDRQYG